MNNMYFDPSVKKYRNTENISILSSKVSTEIQPKYGISISILLWGVLFGFVIGENSFFPRTVLRILFSVFFPYIDTDSQCDDHNIRNRKRTENKHLSDDDHEQLQLSWRRLPPPCDPEGRRAGGSSFVGCPCRQRLSRAHVSPEWAEGGVLEVEHPSAELLLWFAQSLFALACRASHRHGCRLQSIRGCSICGPPYSIPRRWWWWRLAQLEKFSVNILPFIIAV